MQRAILSLMTVILWMNVAGCDSGGKDTKAEVKAAAAGDAEYYVEFGKGIVKEYEVIAAAIEKEIITKTGNTYFYGEIKLGVGQKQLEEFLESNPELLEEIKQKVLEK